MGQHIEEEEDDRCLMIAAALSFCLRDPNQPYVQELTAAQDDEPAWKTTKEAIRQGKKAGAYRLLSDRLYRQPIMSNQQYNVRASRQGIGWKCYGDITTRSPPPTLD